MRSIAQHPFWHFSFLGIFLYGTGFSLLQHQHQQFLIDGPWIVQEVDLPPDPEMRFHFPKKIGSVWHFLPTGQLQIEGLGQATQKGHWQIHGRVLQNHVGGESVDSWISQLSPDRLVLKRRTPNGCLTLLLERHH